MSHSEGLSNNTYITSRINPFTRIDTDFFLILSSHLRLGLPIDLFLVKHIATVIHYKNGMSR